MIYNDWVCDISRRTLTLMTSINEIRLEPKLSQNMVYYDEK